jgi:hypothetical protein
LRSLQSLKHSPQGNDSFETIPGILRPSYPQSRVPVHVSIIVDAPELVNLY